MSPTTLQYRAQSHSQHRQKATAENQCNMLLLSQKVGKVDVSKSNLNLQTQKEQGFD